MKFQNRRYIAPIVLTIGLLVPLLTGCVAPQAATTTPPAPATLAPTSAPLPTAALITSTPASAERPTVPPTNAPAAAPPAPTAAPTAAAQPAPRYENLQDPADLIASYYNAIIRKEYQRAYGYWESPPDGASLAQFAQGYADTAAVNAALRLPPDSEGAAGSVYASLPTVLLATHVDGSAQTFSGCYVARRVNPQIAGQPDTPWRLYSATISPAPADASIAMLLAQACQPSGTTPPGPAYENLSDPVDLLGSFYNAINRKEYRRAYGYWSSPPDGASLAQFAQGYADTTAVMLVIHPPAQYDAGAGSQYARIRSLLVATHADGSTQTYAGCYTAQRANPQIEGAPKDGAWHLFGANIAPVPADTAGTALLAQECTP